MAYVGDGFLPSGHLASGLSAPQILRKPDLQDIPKYAVSLDGGGLVGISQLHVYMAIEEAIKKAGFNGDIRERVSLFAGSSTGAIIAMALNTPLHGKDENQPASAEQVLEFYIKNAVDIFTPEKWLGLPKIRGGKYPQGVLRHKLEALYGSKTTLADAIAPVLVMAFNAVTKVPVVLSTRPDELPENVSEHRIYIKENFNMVDAVMASCAAPTLFNPQFLQSICGMHAFQALDGYLAGNTPVEHAADVVGRSGKPHIISLGTGRVVPCVTKKHSLTTWSALDWVSRGNTGVSYLANAQRNAAAAMADHRLMSRLGPEAYFRIDTTVEKAAFGLDDPRPEALAYFKDFGEQMVTQHRDRIEFLAQQFARHARPVEMPVVEHVPEPVVTSAAKTGWREKLRNMCSPQPALVPT